LPASVAPPMSPASGAAASRTTAPPIPPVAPAIPPPPPPPACPPAPPSALPASPPEPPVVEGDRSSRRPQAARTRRKPRAIRGDIERQRVGDLVAPAPRCGAPGLPSIGWRRRTLPIWLSAATGRRSAPVRAYLACLHAW